MADALRGRLIEVGNAISEGVAKIGNRIGKEAEEAKDWGKDR